MKKAIFLFLVMMASVMIYPSCNASRQTKGAVIGAGAGAAAGAVISKKNKAVAMIFGAAIGGVAGGLIGRYMDQQAAKIEEELEGATVERVGEGILITFDSGMLFDFDSYAMKSETRENLDKLSTTLHKYDETEVLIYGHTDSVGDETYNANLSKKRAGSVHSYLLTKGLPSSRLTQKGFGETDPIASNETAEGRALNRRVEIVIIADKKLQRAAKNGDLPTT